MFRDSEKAEKNAKNRYHGLALQHFVWENNFSALIAKV